MVTNISLIWLQPKKEIMPDSGKLTSWRRTYFFTKPALFLTETKIIILIPQVSISLTLHQRNLCLQNTDLITETTTNQNEENKLWGAPNTDPSITTSAPYSQIIITMTSVLNLYPFSAVNIFWNGFLKRNHSFKKGCRDLDKAFQYPVSIYISDSTLPWVYVYYLLQK